MPKYHQLPTIADLNWRKLNPQDSDCQIYLARYKAPDGAIMLVTKNHPYYGYSIMRDGETGGQEVAVTAQGVTAIMQELAGRKARKARAE